MKYFFFSILIAIIACSSNSATVPASAEGTAPDYNVDEPVMGGPADINIQLTDYNGGGTIRLIGFYLDQNMLMDTFQMKDGKVQIKKDEGYPQGMYYVGLPNQEYLQMMLGEDQKFSMTCAVGDMFGTMKVDGDIENDLFYNTARYEQEFNPEFQAAVAAVSKATKGTPEYEKALEIKLGKDKEREQGIQKIIGKHPNSLFAKFKIGGQNPEINRSLDDNMQVVQYRKDFWNTVDFSDRRLIRTPMIGNKLKRYITELTPQNQDSIISSSEYLINKVEGYPEYFKNFTNWIVIKYEPTKCSLMDPEAVFVHMIQKYFTHEKAFWNDSLMTNTLQKRAFEMAQSRLNQPAPNVISTDLNGNKTALMDMKAPYLVVYMFNPECEHCQEQTPKLIDYYNQHKGEVDVFAIAIETEDKKWKDYAKKLNFPFTSVYDPTNRSIYAKYYVDITPELYVIGPDRTIIGKNLKVFQIDTIIERDKAKRK